MARSYNENEFYPVIRISREAKERLDAIRRVIGAKNYTEVILRLVSGGSGDVQVGRPPSGDVGVSIVTVPSVMQSPTGTVPVKITLVPGQQVTQSGQEEKN